MLVEGKQTESVKMPLRHLLVLVIFVIITNQSTCWLSSRRRRRSCSSVNCQVTSWSSWSVCSAVQCGQPGTRVRQRTILVSPICGGTACPSLQETRPCQGILPMDCQISFWSSWNTCSSSQCGTSGFQNRSRSIIAQPDCGGTACPQNIYETRICYGSLPVDCQYSPWSSWTACPFHCGDVQNRSRYVIKSEQCGGSPCDLNLQQTKACNQTQCLNQGFLIRGECFCPSGYYGSCCQYNGR